jgi:hypothetical protein
MGLLRKVQVLVGALVHKPFMPRPEKADVEERESAAPGPRPSPPEPVAEVVDTERVADLIARRQQDKAG